MNSRGIALPLWLSLRLCAGLLALTVQSSWCQDAAASAALAASAAAASASTPASAAAAVLQPLTQRSDKIPDVGDIGEPVPLQSQKLPPNCGHLGDPPPAVKLLIKGMDSGIQAIGCDPVNELLTFVLAHRPDAGEAANAAWESMFGRPWQAAKDGFTRTVSYTIVQVNADGNAIPLSAGRLRLHILSAGLASLGAVLVVGVWIALVVLGRRSGLVRDIGDAPDDLQERTYSLGRVQMAWWFAMITGSYVFLWVIAGEMPAISGQALVLMGLSGVTGLSALSVDASKRTTAQGSRGFLTDILSDASGVTLYRFQLLATSVIFGVIFVVHVGSHLAMPEFDSNSLILLGISSGTYIGFKLPEGSASTTPPARTADAATAARDADPKAGYAPLPETAPS